MSSKLPEIALPKSLQVERRDEIAILRLARPEKRNALNDPTVPVIVISLSPTPIGLSQIAPVLGMVSWH
jgi:hypothetical protein